jgi:hypothetical protein
MKVQLLSVKHAELIALGKPTGILGIEKLHIDDFLKITERRSVRHAWIADAY